MPISLDIWKLLAGIAIFLLGMNFLEEGLKKLAGRPFKLFLKRQTSNKFKAVAGGAIVTGILQSSSVVNLMVLAFAGTGVVKMQSALAIMLGANLGTTLNSWIVATVGFKFNIESFALPIAGVSGIIMMLSNKEGRLHHWCRLLFGFSFLFIGLGYIRTGVEESMHQLDLSSLNQQPAIVFLLIGLLITSLIQSSSATIAIVLSALHANAISLYAGTAVILGSEIGTTLKLVLASVKGSAVKKRVALGNLLFNVINTFIIFIFLSAVNNFITDVIGIKDNLPALVFFQSLINLVGIILFYPFLDVFGKFLEKRFVSVDKETLFIHKVKPTDTEPAIAALEKETQYFIYHLAFFTLNVFDKSTSILNKLQLSKDFESKNPMEKYEYIKHLHGEIRNYSIQLQNLITDKETGLRLGQLISSARNTMYAAKNIKDTFPDIEQLKKSSNDMKYEFYRKTGQGISDFYEKVINLLEPAEPQLNFERLTAVYKSVQQGYKKILQELYNEGFEKNISEIEFSTIINFNREMYTSEKSVVFALKDYLLHEKQASYFEELPGFIR
jgi:phosphate:Na+ symporter